MDIYVLFIMFASVTINLTLPVTARYCTFEVDSELRYYICPRNEYCCNFGCCLSPTFQFYQLWYYWLMVIFMFLLCSGGGWWYRYWLQGRYGPELSSSMPAPSSRLHPHHLSHRPTRVTYHPSRGDAVVLHHIWKPRGTGAGGFTHASPPPSYASAQRASNSHSGDQSSATTLLASVTVTATAKASPYYQLYGPPPPYEAVIVNNQPRQQQSGAPDTQWHGNSSSAADNSATSSTSTTTATEPPSQDTGTSSASAIAATMQNVQNMNIQLKREKNGQKL